MHSRRGTYAIAALCCLSLAGCAKKGPMSGPTSGNTTSGGAQPGTNASEIISPRKDTWTFDSQPDPVPSATPRYRLNEITFTETSTAFNPEGNGVCRDTAELLKGKNGKILLLGYTHKNESGGQSLGLKRAERVRDCFKEHGLDPARFELSSFGSRYSVAVSTEPMKMEQERRVEVWIISE